MVVKEIYCSTPGINRSLHIGTLTAPFLMNVIQKYTSKQNSEITGNFLFNCHSPEFNGTSIDKLDLDKIVEDRLHEYSSIGINKSNVIIDRDDKIQNETLSQVSNLMKLGYFFVGSGNIYFDISKAKKDFLNRDLIKTVHFFPGMFTKQFVDYLNFVEEPRIISRDLDYGLTSKTLGFTKPISQVQEQILYTARKSSEKLIISGKSVLGHYTFQSVLLNSLLHEQNTSVLIHSTYKVPKGDVIFGNFKGSISSKDIFDLVDSENEGISFLNTILLSSVTSAERAFLNQGLFSKARQLSSKWKNLKNLANLNGESFSNLVESNMDSNNSDFSIEHLLGVYSSNFLDKLVFETLLTSKLISSPNGKKTKNMLFQAKNYSPKMTVDVLESIFN